MPLGNVAKGGYPFRIVVEAGNVMELFPARFHESLAAFQIDFFERLQAVAGKTGADHIDPLYAGLCHFNQRRFGVGLQPFGTSQPGLKSDFVLFLGKPEIFCQQGAISRSTAPAT